MGDKFNPLSRFYVIKNLLNIIYYNSAVAETISLALLCLNGCGLEYLSIHLYFCLPKLFYISTLILHDDIHYESMRITVSYNKSKLPGKVHTILFGLLQRHDFEAGVHADPSSLNKKIRLTHVGLEQRWF